MDIGRAFRYITEDPEWGTKLVILVVMACIPIFGTAVLLGWVIELVRNMRAGEPHPMPRWMDLGTKFTEGIMVVIAAIVYNIPTFALSCCFSILGGLLGSGSNGGGGLATVVVCCTTPLLFIYSLLVWPLLAVGTIRYSETKQSGDLFKFSEIWATVRENSNLTINWMLLSFGINLVLGIVSSVIIGIGFICCIPWLLELAIPAIAVPSQAHLLGQYAIALSDAAEKPKNEPIG